MSFELPEYNPWGPDKARFESQEDFEARRQRDREQRERDDAAVRELRRLARETPECD